MIRKVSDEVWESENFGFYAGFGIRLLAMVIDFIVFLPIILLFTGIAWFGNFNIPSEFFSGVFILYLIIFQWRKGATIGKKQTELRIESADGTRISFGQSVSRQVFPIVSIIIMIILNRFPSEMMITRTYEGKGGMISFTRPVSDWQFYLLLFIVAIALIDVLWVFTNKEKKTLHDIIAKTYCKKK